MGAVANGVFANAVINVIGNTGGFRNVMREVQTQLWGLMTISNRVGGAVTQAILSPFFAFRGMQNVQNAHGAAKLAFPHAMQAWQNAKPQKPTPPNPMMQLWNPAQYAQQMAQYQQGMAAFPGLMAQWKQNKPNKQAFMQQAIQTAALAEGKMLLMLSAVAALGRVMVSAAGYASDFNEELNKMTQTFGNATPGIMAEVNRMGGYGVGRTEMMRGVGTMGIELLGSGLSERIATQLALKLGKRAMDVSSLYNISQDSAMNKFKSGLAGFSRPLKDLGIIISEDKIEVEAFTNGLWDGRSALTEDVKVRTRALMILRETDRAEGDYIKTRFELANQYRALQGNFSNLMETIGNHGIIQGATLSLNAFLFTVDRMIQGLQKLYKGYADPVYKFFSGGADPDEDSEIQQRLASRRNLGSQSRAYADAVIQDVFLGKGRSARHMGLADVHKSAQESVFNNKDRMIIDLNKQLVDLTKEQIRLLRQLGHHNFVGQAIPGN